MCRLASCFMGRNYLLETVFKTTITEKTTEKQVSWLENG